eukprot:9468898-Pyramimonas_sp.AAC.1
MVKDPLAWHEQVQEALARWRARKQAGAERLLAWRASLPACQVGVLGRLDPFLMGEMLAEACLPDE